MIYDSFFIVRGRRPGGVIVDADVAVIWVKDSLPIGFLLFSTFFTHAAEVLKAHHTDDNRTESVLERLKEIMLQVIKVRVSVRLMEQLSL